MRIIKAITEAKNPIGASKVAENLMEVHNKGKGDNKIVIGANTKVTMDNLTLLAEAIIIINYYGNYQGRGGHGHDGNNYRGRGHRQGNYRGHNNYQYHQYYTHDDGSQVEQYGPPCTLCGGFNHSPKHCFKGEHDINKPEQFISIMGSMTTPMNSPKKHQRVA